MLKTRSMIFKVLFTLIFIASIVIPVSSPTVANAATRDITIYGATPNDNTDDTSAIQNAITAAVNGDTVYIPNGTFNVSANINCKSGVKIEGQSQAGAILKFTGTAAITQLLTLNNCSNVELTKFTLDGNSNDYLHNGIWAEPANNILVHFLTIKDLTWHDSGAFGPHGLLFANTSDCEVSDCTITNMGPLSGGGSGMRIGYNSTRAKILRNTIANTGEGGIRCNVGCTDFIIRNNTVTGSGLMKEGLSIECYSGCSRFIVEDNNVDAFLSMALCDYSATRRNIISDTTGRHITNGLEAASSNSIYTDNTINDGHHVGLSISGAERYQYIGYNTFQAENLWGAQLQGDSSQIKYQYFYKDDFNNQPLAHGNVPYPGYEGEGFRINGNTDYLDFENCNFNNNARLGFEVSGAGNVNHISMVNCNINNNTVAAFSSWSGYAGFEMVNCTVTGNGNNSTPASSSFNNQRPVAVINSTDAGGGTINFSSGAYDPDGSISHVLWDFGDGVPTDVSNPTHIYTTAGAYRVTLLAWDNQGRGARAETYISIGGAQIPTPTPTPIPTPTPTPIPTPTPNGIKLTGTLFGTAGSWSGGTEYDKAYDGNINTFFDCTQTGGAYTGMDLGAGHAQRITKVRFYPRINFPERMVGGRFQGSNTSSSSGFVDLYTITTTPVLNWTQVEISNTNAYRYLRYISSDSSGYCNVAEVEFYSISGATPTPTPTATATATPTATPTPTPTPGSGIKLSGVLYGTSGSWNGGDDFTKAFDGNTATFFDCTTTSGSYTGMDLGAGNAKRVTKIRFYPRSNFPDRMVGGKFQGSNTSGTSGFVNLYTVTSIPPVNWTEVAVSDTNSYRYLRYVSPDYGCCNVSEIEFYGN